MALKDGIIAIHLWVVVFEKETPAFPF